MIQKAGAGHFAEAAHPKLHAAAGIFVYVNRTELPLNVPGSAEGILQIMDRCRLYIVQMKDCFRLTCVRFAPGTLAGT